jgi:phosphomannomutase
VQRLKIGTSWVRGVVGEALTPDLVVDFACAFGTWCDGAPVVIARDTRGSSRMLQAAVTSALLSTGCEVVDLGVGSTPLVSFAVRELGAEGGISITGSHNDAEWNALKFVGPDGALLNAVKSEELLDIFHAAQFRLVPSSALRSVTRDGEKLATRYREHLLASLDVAAIRARRFRVAVDFANGGGAALARPLLDALGVVLLPLNDEPSGIFAHPPAPTPANMKGLAEHVTHVQADLGAGLNVDGDRVGFVTREGTALSEEYALPLAAAARLRRRPGPIVTNLSTSSMVEAVAAGCGQRVLRAPVGESHVIDQGMAEGAVLAGEGSGGVAVLPAALTFDGLLTLALVLEEMAVGPATLADLVGRLPRFTMRKHELPCEPHVVYKVVEAFRAHYADRNPDTSDGVRVAGTDGWTHVRASNTEPLLRVIVEAQTPLRANTLLAEALAFAQRMMKAAGG